jgi:hypothetical protein
MGNTTDSRALAAKSWFGYGRWDAPYWYVGMEPGGTDDDANYDSWLDLGGGELIDCKQHHLHPLNTGANGKKFFFGDRPPTQTTWRRLIQTRFAFKGQEKLAANLDDVAKFQKESFGSICGDIALIELSALHARSLKDKHVDRTEHLRERISLIAKRLDENPQTKFVLFYGLTYRNYYQELASGPFDDKGTFCWRKNTLCVLTRHPVRSKPEFWIDLGKQIRERIGLRQINTTNAI